MSDRPDQTAPGFRQPSTSHLPMCQQKPLEPRNTRKARNGLDSFSVSSVSSAAKRLFKPSVLTVAAAGSLLLVACSEPPEAPVAEVQCEPESAFLLGRADEPAPAECEDRTYTDAWQLGQTLGEMERERDQLAAQEEELDAAGRMRLRVLQRDIPELETLARIQGLKEHVEPEME